MDNLFPAQVDSDFQHYSVASRAYRHTHVVHFVDPDPVAKRVSDVHVSNAMTARDLFYLPVRTARRKTIIVVFLSNNN